MKKFLLIVTLLFSALGFSQAIDVSTTSHTVPQLVNNVLINSPCVQASNVTWSTGTNFGSSNGIGYFTNTNPNFPMQSGVVLSTGNAEHAEGPNTSMLNEGSAGWSGDSDLEATLAQAGISMTSANATVLEFDFTPISNHFDFAFIFASEEYGNYQCQFSDAFAFLLTNVNTGVTTNLAVVPTTSTPISVVTIRDFLYNSGCPSVNPQYFGAFNGGSAAAGSATNFNGQTVLMNAAASLIPNTPYHIKLVIADRSDFQSDSAIFMSSNSFNIGQNVLGLDLTVANNTALCFGQPHVLDTGLNAADYTFTWKKNNVAIAGATGPTLAITTPGTYTVTYANVLSLCDPITDSVIIEYLPQIVTPSPINLYRCNSGAATYNYDLTINTPKVTAGVTPTPLVSYFASSADANNNTNPLPNTYASTGNQTIYVRIQRPGTPCYIVKTFQLLVTAAAVANQAPDLVKCARSQSQLNNYFNLNTQTAIILGSQSAAVNAVRYYTSATNAANATNQISPSNNVLLGNQTVYVRIQNLTDPACFALSSFNIIINPIPPVDILPDVIVCDPFVLQPLVNGNYFTGPDGTGTPLFAGDVISTTQLIYIYNFNGGPPNCPNTSKFKVTVIDPLTLSPSSGSYCGSYTLPALEYGQYRTEPAGGGTVVPPGTVVTATQTFYIYYVTLTEPFCTIDTDVHVTILPTPVIGTFQNVFDCISYTLPPLSNGNYFTEPNGQGTQLPAGTVITNSQTVYVYAVGNTTPACNKSASFNVVIGVTIPTDVAQCSPYVLPPLAIGNYYTGPNGTGNQINAGTSISQSATIYVNIPNGNSTNCAGDLNFTVTISQPAVDTLPNVSSCESYTLPTLTNGSYYTGTGGTGTMMHAGDVILTSQKVYIYSQLAGGCTNQSSFNVTITPLPAIDSRSSIDACDSYTLTNLNVGNYYTGPNGTGTQLAGGHVITQSQTVYIYGVNSAGCATQNSFDIFIFSVVADAPAPVTVCDSYTLPALVNGNYYTQTNGNGTQIPAGTVITQSTTLYVYLEAAERALTCRTENVFQITINHTPNLAPVSDVFVCNSYTLPVLTAGNYFTGPNGTGTVMNAGDVLTTDKTIYVYGHSATSPDCVAEKTFHVTIFNVEQKPDATRCDSYTLPALAVGQYYTGPNGTGTQLNPGDAVTSTKTIYVYAQSPFTPTCSDQTSFVVTIIGIPVINVTDLFVCNSYTLPVLPAGNYYTGPNGTGTLMNAGDILTAADQTIYVYAQTNTTPNCTNEKSFHVNIFNIADQPDATTCGSFTLPALTIGQYYTGPGATGSVLPAGSAVTSTKTIYVYAQSPLNPACYDETSFEVTIIPIPAINVTDLFVCDSYTLPVLPAGNYYTGPNGTGTLMNAGDILTAADQTIYVYAQTNTTPNCTNEKSFHVNIFNIADQPDVTTCGSFTLPVLSAGQYYTGPGATGTVLPAGSEVTSTKTIYVYAQSPFTTACYDETSFEVTIIPIPAINVTDLFVCNSYTLPVLPAGNYYTGPNATGSVLNAGDVLTTDQTVYVYAQTNTTPNCTNEKSFHITIFNVAEQADITTCGSFELPVLAQGQYYTGANGTGSVLPAGSLITSTKTIYIRAQSPFTPNCYDQTTFVVNIIPIPVINVSDIHACNSYTLPVLPAGNYYTGANGTGSVLNAGDVLTTDQTVYVHAETGTTPNCTNDQSFTVTIFNIPAQSDVTTCGSYELPVIAQGQYYTGTNGTGVLLPAGSLVTATKTIYVRAASPFTPTCYDETSFVVNIIPIPAINVSDIHACNSYTLPALPAGNYFSAAGGTGNMLQAGDVLTTDQTVYVFAETATTPNCTNEGSFNVTIFNVDAVADVTTCASYQLPALTVGQYYTGTNGTGVLLPAGSLVTSTKTIFVRAASPFTPTCYDETSFVVNIIPLPAINVSDIHACNSYTLPALAVGNYYTATGGTGTMLHAGDVLTTDQTVFVYAETGTTPNCTNEGSFSITIFNVDAPADVTSCGSYVLPALTIGQYYSGPNGAGFLPVGATVSSTKTIYVRAASPFTPTCYDETSFVVNVIPLPAINVSDVKVCNSYTLPALTVGQYYSAPGGTGTILQAGDVLTADQTIYVYATTGTTPNCSNEKSFTVTIFNVDDIADVTTCGGYTLPVLTNGKYYTGPGGSGVMLPMGGVLTITKTVYIYAPSPFTPTCYDETSFVVTIIPTPVAHTIPAAMLTVCDEDGTNDGDVNFQLTGFNPIVLGSQTAPEFSVTWYESLDDANAQTNAVTSSELHTVYVRVNNALAPGCYDVKPVTIKVNKLPRPLPIPGVICFESATQTAINPYTIPSGLSSSGYTFVWKNEAGLVVGTASTYTATLPGTYYVTATSTTTGCTSESVPVIVIASEPAVVGYAVSEDFTQHQSLTVTATGTGTAYEYQLDFGTFQTSPVFTDVASGWHTITVKDAGGCGDTTIEALVINYPHYFTPNGDGFHDTWNIWDLKDLPSLINIFDRYGKLLTQIKPGGAGWDGNYNGNPMPSSDYWFTVNYEKDGKAKEFKAHFSMKR